MSAPSKRGSLDEQAEMLPQDPPPFVARSIAWLLIALFLSAVIAAIVVRLPETVICPFVLVPVEGADPIRASGPGVLAEVHVAESDEVKAGQELFVLRSSEMRGKDTDLRTLKEDLRAKKDSIGKSESLHTAQLRINQAEIMQVEREIEFRRKHATVSRDLVTRLSRLAASGGISQIELARLQLDQAESEKDLNVVEKNLDAVGLARERLEIERARERSDDDAATNNLKSRITALERDLENATLGQLSIRAPYAAMVISMQSRTVGDVLETGQELCQLAPITATPQARILLKEQGLSRLATGQRVRLFFEAFPYQRYGTITGRLDWISPAAIAFADGPHFMGRASLDQTVIRVNGEPSPLRVGMKGDARIAVGSRRLIDYAFGPIRQLRENLRQ